MQWEVLTELNTARYDVQRSTDGRNFTTIGSVPATNAMRYQFTDQYPLTGNNFYRVQNIDLDNTGKLRRRGIGKYNRRHTAHRNVSQPGNGRKVLCSGSPIWEKGNYQLELYSNSGQRMFGKTIDHAGGSAAETLQLPVAIPAGVYQLRIKTTTIMINQSLIMQ
ncbi:MAG: hypothetical protein WDO19_30615 [Bacteroidota bacterium]